jgi:hypothetical protein
MAEALLAQQARRPGAPVADEVSLAVLVLCGAARHESLLALLDGGLRLLAPGWRLDAKLLCSAEAGLRVVIGPPAVFCCSAMPASFDPAGAGAVMEFAFRALLFG